MWCGCQCCSNGVKFAQGHSVGSPCVTDLMYQYMATVSRYAETTTKVLPKKPEWVDVFRTAQDTCPNVLQLVDLLLSLPASSADCERGFSLTKVISQTAGAGLGTPWSPI